MNKEDQIFEKLNILWYNIDESGRILHFETNSPGVYVYRNILELDKVYIGSTATLSKRTKRHQSEVAQGKAHVLDSTMLYVNMVGHNFNLES
ncbi:hypothetical protein CLOP_g21592 [Closterium sp. NIES-67]|nr:hypothetical protein CLOP_g21592 [Closterium sp. NIES-67]